jgi:hypothetical protein
MSQTKVQQSAFENFKGRDLSIENLNQIGSQTIMPKEPDFSEISLEQYKSSNFKSPKIISDLLEIIRKQRFLVLAGSSDVYKDSLAKCTASRLIEELESSGDEIIAKEWHRRSEPQIIEIGRQNTVKTTVFILNQVTPQNIGYHELERIRQDAVLGKHYVVMITDKAFRAWQEPDSEKEFWYEVSREDVADCEQFINPRSQEDSLSKRYLKLKSRERLLVLGLSFFDGLFEDQFFAALEEIVEKVWQRRDASLRALDYCDFENFSHVFNYTKTEDQRTICSPEERRTLFNVAWKSDRRQILLALPVLVNIVKKSVVESLVNLELYGSERRCREIRQVIAETISDIGSISENSIETTLLQLSADKNTSVQSTAAYAMARWRDSDCGLDQQLFNMLHSWLDLTKSRLVVAQVEAIIKGRNEENSESSKAEDYIKGTVALTVGYASLYDPPRGLKGSEGLSEELYKLLKKLANDNSNIVRNVFLNDTLPMVLQIHLKQLSKWLHDMIKQQVSSSSSETSITKFNKAVGLSLALAYKREPEETVKVLENWTDEGLRNLPEYIDISKTTSRESLLATVVRTYGEIECVKNISELTPNDIFKRLHSILQKEKHPFVREAILFSIGRQARLHFDAIEPQLQSLVAEVNENEREDIVRVLTEIYLEQRVDLLGGDYWSNRKSSKIGRISYRYKYQIWINNQRPQTQIEEAMYGWIKNACNTVAQQIATRSFISFANLLDKDEEQERDRILRNLDQEPSSNELEQEALPTKTSQDFYVEKIVPWITVFFKWIQYFSFKRDYYKPFADEWSYYRQVITGILPEALKQDSSSQSTMDFVLKRLTGLPDKKLKIIADLLKLAIGIAKKPGFIILAGVMLVIFFFWFFIK